MSNVKKVSKYYAFNVEKSPEVPLMYAKAACESLRRQGLDIYVKEEKQSDGSFNIAVYATFIPTLEVEKLLHE